MKLILQKNATEIRRLHKRLHETHRVREQSAAQHQAYLDALAEFQGRYDGLAFPNGLTREFELLKTADVQAAANAIAYLEAHPYYFRSQYIAGSLRRALNKIIDRMPPDIQARYAAYRLELIEWKRLRRPGKP